MSTARIKTFRKSKRAQGFEPSTSSLGIRSTDANVLAFLPLRRRKVSKNRMICKGSVPDSVPYLSPHQCSNNAPGVRLICSIPIVFRRQRIERMERRTPAAEAEPAARKFDPKLDQEHGVDPGHREFFELGRMVDNVLREGARSKAAAAVRVAEQLRATGRTGWKPGSERYERALDFFQRFDEVDLRRLGKIKNRQGQTIPETYLYILSVEDPDHREALLSFLERERRTRADLLSENRRLRGEQLGRGGQRHRPPGSLREAVEQTIAAADDWLKLEAVGWPEKSPMVMGSWRGRRQRTARAAEQSQGAGASANKHGTQVGD